MAVPQRARLWLGAFAFSAALALSSSYAIHSATARNIKRTSSTDLTPTLAEQRSPPPETVVAAVLDAGRSTGIDPALLLTIAATESRFQANAKNRTSRQRGCCNSRTDLAREPEEIWGKAWLEPFSGSDLSVRRWLSCCTRSRQEQNIGLRNDPRIATLLAAERLDYQKEQSKDRHLQVVDFYLIHALGVSGANRFIEAVSNRPSVPCKAVVGDVAWKGSGLFRDLPHGAATSLGVAYDAISVRFEQSRSYYASLLEHDATAAYPKPEPEEAGYWAAPR